MTSPTLSRTAWRLAALFVTASLAVAACRKDDEKNEKKAEPTAAKVSAEGDKGDRARRARPQEEGIDVPAEEDFEEAVPDQITPETDLQKELISSKRTLPSSRHGFLISLKGCSRGGAGRSRDDACVPCSGGTLGARECGCAMARSSAMLSLTYAQTYRGARDGCLPDVVSVGMQRRERRFR